VTVIEVIEAQNLIDSMLELSRKSNYVNKFMLIFRKSANLLALGVPHSGSGAVQR